MSIRTKVNAGQKLTVHADEYNGLLEMFDKYRTGEVVARPRTEPRKMPGGLIRVRNDTGAPLARFAVVAIDEPLFAASVALDSFKQQIVAKGTLPTAANQGRLAIVQEPADTGAVVSAIAAGLSVVQVDVTDLAHEWAVPVASDAAKLQSSEAGSAYIIYPATATGVQWTVVRLGNPVEATPTPVPEWIDAEVDSSSADIDLATATSIPIKNVSITGPDNAAWNANYPAPSSVSIVRDLVGALSDGAKVDAMRVGTTWRYMGGDRPTYP